MKRFIAILALAAGVAVVGSSQPASAGDPGNSVDIRYEFFGGPDALAAAQAIQPELFEDGVTDVSTDCAPFGTGGDVNNAFATANCTNLTGTSYTIGGAPIDGYQVDTVTCNTIPPIGPIGPFGPQKAFEDPNATFAHSAGDQHDCSVTLVPVPKLFVDVVVTGGPAVASDFEVEVYDTDGGPIIATGTDPSDNACNPFPPVGTDCAEIDLASGDYFLGASEVQGYVPVGVTCEVIFDQEDKQFPATLGAFGHGGDNFDTLCTIELFYVTQTVSADIEVINDDGGTATGADFTIEIFDSTDTLVNSGVDPEPGTGNASFESTLPIGDYTFGVTGPDGYDVTAAVTFEPVALGAPIDDPSADFTLTADARAIGVITADDQPSVVTTTTAPTTTTTAPPAPTTTIAAVLPETGSSSTQPVLLLSAIALLLFGSGAVLATRRH